MKPIPLCSLGENLVAIYKGRWILMKNALKAAVYTDDENLYYYGGL